MKNIEEIWGKVMLRLFIFFSALACVLPIYGADVLWDGPLASGNTHWSYGPNWVSGSKPTNSDNAFFNSQNTARWEPTVSTSESTQNLTLVARKLEITADLTVTDNTFVSANLELAGGHLATGNFVLANGSELTMSPSSNLDISGNVTVLNSTISANGNWTFNGNGQDLTFQDVTLGSNLQVSSQSATAQSNFSGNLEVREFTHSSGNLEIGASSNFVSIKNMTLARTGGNLVVNSANLRTSSPTTLNDADLIVEAGSLFRLINNAEVQVGYYLLQKNHAADLTGGTLSSNVTVIGKIWSGFSANLTNESPETFLRWQEGAVAGDQRLATDNLIFAGNGYMPTITPEDPSTGSSEDITANDVVISTGNLNINGNLMVSNNFYSDANLNMTSGNMMITGGMYVEAYGEFGVDAGSRVEVGGDIVIVASDNPANFQGNAIMNGTNRQKLETATRLDLLTVQQTSSGANVFLTGNVHTGTFTLGDGDVIMDQGHNFVIDEGLTMGGGNFNIGSSNLYLYDINLSTARDFDNTTAGNIYVSSGGNLKLNDFNLSANTLFSATGRYTFDLHGTAPFNDNISWIIGQPDMILRDSGVTSFDNVNFSTIYSIDAFGAGMAFTDSTVGVSENIEMASGTMTINDSYVTIGLDLNVSNGNVLLNSGNLVIGNDLITGANSSVDFVAGNVSADNLTFDGTSFTYTDDVTFFNSDNLLFDDVPGYNAWTTVSNIIINSSNVQTNATNIFIGGYLELNDTRMTATDIYLSGVSDNVSQTGNTVSAGNNIWVMAGASYRVTNGNLTAGNIIINASTLYSDGGNITTSGNGVSTSVNAINIDYDLTFIDSLGYFAGTGSVHSSVNLSTSNITFVANSTTTFDSNIIANSSNIHVYNSANVMVAENLSFMNGALLNGEGTNFILDVDQTLSFSESTADITGAGSNVIALDLTIESNSFYNGTATSLLVEDDLTIIGGNLIVDSGTMVEVVDDMNVSAFGGFDFNSSNLLVGGEAYFIDSEVQHVTSDVTVNGNLTYSSNTSLVSSGGGDISVTGNLEFHTNSSWTQTGLDTVNVGLFKLINDNYDLGFSADFYTAANTTITAGNFHHTSGNAVVGNLLIEEDGCFTQAGGDFRATLVDIFGGKLDISGSTNTADITDLSMDDTGATLFVSDDTTIQTFEMVGGDIYHYSGNLTIVGNLHLSGNYIYLGGSGQGNLNVCGNLTVPAGAQFLPGPLGTYTVKGTTTIDPDSTIVVAPNGAFTWSGNSNTLWGDAGNWSTTPTSADNVWIAHSASLPNEPDVQVTDAIRSAYVVTSTLTVTSELDILENINLYGATLDIGTSGILDVTGNVAVHLTSSLGTLNNGNIQIGGNLLINNAAGTLFNGKLTFDGVDQEMLVNGAFLRDIVIDSSSSTGNVRLSDNLNTRSVEVLSGNLDVGANDLRINNDTNIGGTLSIGGGNVLLLDTLDINNRNLQIETGGTLKMTAGSNLVVNDLILESGSTFIGEGVYGITVMGSIKVNTNNWTSGMGNVTLLGDSSDSTFSDIQFYDLSVLGMTEVVLSGTNLSIENNFRLGSNTQIDFQSTPLTVGGNLFNGNLIVFDGADPLKIQTMDDTVGTLRFDGVSGGNINIRPVIGTTANFSVYRFEVLSGDFVSSTNLSLGNLLIMDGSSKLTTPYISFDIDDAWSTAGTLEVENGTINTNANYLYPRSGGNLTLRNSSMTGFNNFYSSSADVLYVDSDFDVTTTVNFWYSDVELNRGTMNTSDLQVLGGTTILRDYVLNLSDDLFTSQGADITHVGGEVSVGDDADLNSTSWNITSSNIQIGGDFTGNILTWVSSTDNVYFESAGNLVDTNWTATSNLYFMDQNLLLWVRTVASSNAALTGGNLELVGNLDLDSSYFSYGIGGNANFSSVVNGDSSSRLGFYSTNVTIDSGLVLTNSSSFISSNTTLGISANLSLDNSQWSSSHDTLTITDAILLDNSSDVSLMGNTGTLSVPNITSLDSISVFHAESGPVLTMQTGTITLSETSGSYIHNMTVPVGITTTQASDVTLMGNILIYGNLDQGGENIYLSGGNFYLGLISTLVNPDSLIVSGSSNFADGKGTPSIIGDLDVLAGGNLLLLGDITIGGNFSNLGIFQILGWDVNDVGGTFDNQGTIVLHGDADFNIPTDPFDLINLGTIQYVDGAPTPITLGLNNPDAYDSLILSGTNTYFINDTVTIQGTLQIDASSNIYIGPGKTLALEGSIPSFSEDDIINDGTLFFQGGATATLTGGDDLGFVQINDASTVVTITGGDANFDGLIIGADATLDLSTGNMTISDNGIDIFADGTFTTTSGTNVNFSGNSTYKNAGTTSIQNITVLSGSNLILLSDIEVTNLITVQNSGTLRTYETTTDQSVSSVTLDNDGTVLSYSASGTFSTNMNTDDGLVHVIGTSGPYTIGSPWLNEFYDLRINEDWTTSSNVLITNGFYSSSNVQLTVDNTDTLSLTYASLTVNDNLLLSASSNLDTHLTSVSLMSNIILADQAMMSANHLVIETSGNLTSLARSTVRVAGNFHVLGNWSEGWSNLIWEGAGNFYAPNETFFDLSFDGNVFSFNEDITVSNNLNVISGNFTWGLTEASSGNLSVSSGGNFNLTSGNLQVGSDISVEGIANISSNVTAGQNLTISGTWDQPSGNLYVTSDANVSGAANVTGSVTVIQDLTVTGQWTQNSGNLQVNSDLTVSGTGNVTGYVTVGDNLSVWGEWYQTAGNLQVASDATINGNVNLVGIATVGGNLSATDQWTQTSGNLEVIGHGTFNGNVDMTGAVTVGGNFIAANQWTQTSGNLEVTGQATVGGNISLTDNASVGGNLIVTGQWAQTSGNLQVTSDLTVHGTGNVVGSVNVGGQMGISGQWTQTSSNLQVGANLYVSGMVDIDGEVTITDNLMMMGHWTQLTGNLQVGSNLIVDGVGNVMANVVIGQDMSIAGDWVHNSGNFALTGNVTIGAGNLTIVDITPDFSGNLGVYLTTSQSFLSVSDNLALDLSIPMGTLEHSGGDIVFPALTGVRFGGNYFYRDGAGNVVVSNGNLTIEEGATFDLGSGGNLILENGVTLFPLGDLTSLPGSSITMDSVQISSGNLELSGATTLQSLVITGGNVSLGGNLDMTSIAISSEGNLTLQAGASVNLVNLTMTNGNIFIESGVELMISGNFDMTGGNLVVASDANLIFLNESVFTSSQSPLQIGDLLVMGGNLTLNTDHLTVGTLVIDTSANLIQGSNTLVVNSQLTIKSEGWLWNASGNLDLSSANLSLQASSNLLHGRALDLSLMSGNIDGGLAVSTANLHLTGSLSSGSSANISAMDLLPSSSTWMTSGDLSFANLMLTSSTLSNGGGDVVLSGAIWIDASSNLQQDTGSLSVTGSVNVNGGVFDLNSTSTDFTSTDLIIYNDALVELSDNFSDNLVFLSGTLVQQSGNLTLNDDFSISANVVVNGTTTWNLPAGSNVTVEAGGSLSVGPTGDLNFSTGVDFILYGDLQAQTGAGMSVGNLILNVANVDLSNFSSLAIESVTVSNGTVTLASGNSSFTQVTVDTLGSLVFPTGANLTVANGFVVDGTVTMQSGSMLVVQGGSLDTNGASMGNVVIAGNVTQQEGDLQVTDLTVLSGGNYLMNSNIFDATGNVRIANGGNLQASVNTIFGYSINTENRHQVDGGYDLQGSKTLVGGSLVVGSEGTYASNTDMNGSATVFNGVMTDGYALNIDSSGTLSLTGATTNPASNGLDIVMGPSISANLVSSASLGNLTIGTDAMLLVSADLAVADDFENGGNLHLYSSNVSIATMDTNSGTVVFGDGSLDLGGSNSPITYYNLEMNLTSSDENVSLSANVTVNGDLTSTSTGNTRLVSSGYDLNLLGSMIENNVASSSNLGVSGCVILGASSNLSGTIYADKLFMTTPATQFGPLTEAVSLNIKEELVINGTAIGGNISLDFSGVGLAINLDTSVSTNLNYVEFNNVTFGTQTFAYNSRNVNGTNLATEFVQLVANSGSNLQAIVDVDWVQILQPGETFPTIRIYRVDTDGNSTGSSLSGDIASGAGNTFAWSTNLLSDGLGEIYLGAFSSDGSTRLSDTTIGPFTLDNHLNLQTPDGTGQIPRFDATTGVVTFNFDHIPDGVVPGLISLDGTYGTNLADRVISPVVNGTTQPTLTLDDLGILAVSEATNFILSEGAFTWNGNTLSSTNTNTFLALADTTEPTLVNWALDLNTRQLSIEFNEPLSENGLSADNITLSYGASNSHTLSTSSTIARVTTTAPSNLIVSLANADYQTLAGFVSSSATVQTWEMYLSNAFAQNLYGESYTTTGNTGGTSTAVTSANLALAIYNGDVSGQDVFTSIFDDTTLSTTETLDLASALWATVDPTSSASLPDSQSYTTGDGKTWFAAYNSTSNNSTLPVASTPLPSFTVSGIPNDAIFTALVTPLDQSELPADILVASDLLSFHLYDNDGSGNTYTGGSFSIDVRFMNLSNSGYPDAPEKYTMYSFSSDDGSSQASSHVISDGGDDAITVTFTTFSEYILVYEQIASPFASGGGGGGCLLRPDPKKEDQD